MCQALGKKWYARDKVLLPVLYVLIPKVHSPIYHIFHFKHLHTLEPINLMNDETTKYIYSIHSN